MASVRFCGISPTLWTTCQKDDGLEVGSFDVMSFRIPVEEEYCAFLGRAVYVFAYYEWIVIKMIDHFSPGYVQEYLVSKWMSGRVAGKLEAVIQECDLSDSHLRGELETEANRFLKLVDVRNKLIHAHPYTATSGDQQLLHHRLFLLREVEI